MWRIALLLTLFAAVLPAQRIFGTQISPGLVSYLELTQPQQEQIVRANQTLSEFSAQKARRSAQVEAEIQAELAKADPDPMALGVRYRELEAIRRETAAEQTRAMQTIQTVLTAAQKLKVAMLQEAMRLQSTACEAVSWNLMTIPPPVIIPVLSPLPVGSISGILGGSVVSTCGTPAFRTGDFTFEPVLPTRP